ncbi:MAG TPA: UDP-N-acetylglucosamine 1-carboxyvinyltransferase [Candidatus Acetothermia bacterium]|nr:UDP-N-acetylglucosamine 1-carboxyvinyltransferase [Candidatus Acetothermia bacterium]
MEHFVIRGDRPLLGTITISGAKNAALPACVASLLTDDEVTIDHVPRLRDVQTILSTISSLGKLVVRDGERVSIACGGEIHSEAQAGFVEQMRASFLVLGPLVARLGRALVPLPGGCKIGARSVDLHLHGLRALGARVTEKGNTVTLVAKHLRGARISLPFPSVGATEQIAMSACLAKGETVIENAAWEPEVMDLVALLNDMGGEIEYRDGSLHVRGRPTLHGTRHAVIPDRMEAGTYLIASAITGGDVTVRGVVPEHLRLLLSILSEMGCKIEETDGAIRLTRGSRPHPIDTITAPYPGFPTDLQPPLVALLSLAQGKSSVEERIFEHRFTYTATLRQMGARITVSGRRAVITGVDKLHATAASAPDIRAGAALVLAALAAQGESTIDNLEQIDRGYEHMAQKLRSIGGDIERVG